jgi:hypothetical protein
MNRKGLHTSLRKSKVPHLTFVRGEYCDYDQTAVTYE